MHISASSPERLLTDTPHLTARQMAEVDRAMTEDYGIELIQMMENAGRNLAHLARTRFLETDARGKTVAVLSGTGGNGGGALVCARRLAAWGALVTVATTKPRADFAQVSGHQLDIVTRMGVPVIQPDALVALPTPDLIVDGVIGYSLAGAPRGSALELIRWANDSPVPVLSLDVPSGVDVTTGSSFEPSVSATATMTLALPKQGLKAADGVARWGELYLADISVPPTLYAELAMGPDVGPIFARDEIIRLL